MALAGAAAPTMAADNAPKREGPCAADVKKFCGDVKPGEGRIARCMKSHEKDLSPACREHEAAVKARVKEAHEACRGDVEKFCKDVKPGGGRIIACLKSHEKDLSPACREQHKRGNKAPAAK